MKLGRLLFLYVLIIFSPFATAQIHSHHFKIVWQDIQKIRLSEDVSINRMHFTDAQWEGDINSAPLFNRKIKLDNNTNNIVVSLSNDTYQDLTKAEMLTLENLVTLGNSVNLSYELSKARGQAYVVVTILPFRLDARSGKYQKLVTFDLEIDGSIEGTKSSNELTSYADHSVLAGGNWFKARVDQTGIYKLTYADLNGMGMGMQALKSDNIRLYGNSGGMLPEPNNTFRYDDLQENAIAMFDGGDGQFNEGDYFLFYGQSPDMWGYDDDDTLFLHHKNVYSDHTYYFITPDLGSGKRIQTTYSTGDPENYIANKFLDYSFHEIDDYNLIKSGREWYGEIFDLQTTYAFPFSFPNLLAGANHHINVKLAAKSQASSSFFTSVNGVPLITTSISAVPIGSEGDYARTKTGSESFTASGSELNVEVKYNKSTTSSIGWLDYVAMNAWRSLSFTGNQMAFRDPASIAEGRISKYQIGNASTGVTIWEVTDPLNVAQVNTGNSGSSLVFKLETNYLREFVAFNGAEYYTVEFVEQIENQDLHSVNNVDYIIISHPDFLSQASRLGDFHKSNSGLRVHITIPQKVYNEFSSGSQDVTAFRDFMKMLYDRADDNNKPKYLLLFGDASYDFKNRIADNSNFVPTFESVESLHQINSYATDDYFGFLDDGEGGGSNELLDIGIGRFVVRTIEEAENAVDKSVHYATSPTVLGDWRNIITFVADDENSNSHMTQAEELANFVDTTYRWYNIDKIYLDAYNQVSTPGGQRYPEVNAAINTRMEKGTLIMNYTGHGGEVGWAHERVLELSDINSWTNWDKLSVFVTATCEFTRYDDPGRISAGEYVFLNPDGGGISLFTTARATFGGSNLSLNRGFYKHAFETVHGEHHAMGDLIRLAKYESTSQTNDKKFILIGDPALKMAYAKYKIETTAINNQVVASIPDTMKALSNVSISGKIVDQEDRLLSNYNGILYSSVFDKESELTTFGHDEGSSPKTFKLRKNVIYKGKAQVTAGNFTFSFVVPKDIAYQFGTGKLSFYAEDGEWDATGYYENVVVGGFDQTSTADNEGPVIDLFMNDNAFKSGGITNKDPVLYAEIYDFSGINTVGNGIGHDIVAVLNEDTENSFILNDYYEADLGSYQNGTIEFPFFDLLPGDYTVRLKVWDVYNNSSEASMTFSVVDQEELMMHNLINYPNPFTNETYFKFNHNRSNADFRIRIEIFDLTGRPVASLSDHYVGSGFYINPVAWDGTNNQGSFLKGGIYVYRVIITEEDGRQTSAVEKLMLNR